MPPFLYLSCFTDNVYKDEDIIGVYTTTVAVGLTIVLCVITAGFAFFNTFGAYTSWLYGPPMLYVLAFISGLCYIFYIRTLMIFVCSFHGCTLAGNC